MEMKENNTLGINEFSRQEYKELRNIYSIQIPCKISTDAVLNIERAYIENVQDVNAETSKEEKIVSAFDVACSILQHYKSPISTMKLHKLLYYCQAWHLVWEEKLLFKEKIEAWANGPVIREIFNFHRGMYEISVRNFPLGNSDLLSKAQLETIDSVLDFYGNRNAQWLIDQTHSELPWRNARKGLLPNERGDAEIAIDDMLEYYSSLK